MGISTPTRDRDDTGRNASKRRAIPRLILLGRASAPALVRRDSRSSHVVEHHCDRSFGGGTQLARRRPEKSALGCELFPFAPSEQDSGDKTYEFDRVTARVNTDSRCVEVGALIRRERAGPNSVREACCSHPIRKRTLRLAQGVHSGAVA
jgi:hypothetical protein